MKILKAATTTATAPAVECSLILIPVISWTEFIPSCGRNSSVINTVFAPVFSVCSDGFGGIKLKYL